jgi:pyruvate formate lyase activating enzyme
VTAAAPPYVAPRSVKDTLTIAGLTRLSTCDWPGHLVATVFLQGCPWRCGYCHNPGLLDPTTPGQVPWQDVRDLLLRRQGMLDGVVFSGGEPTRQDGLVAAVHEVAELGYAVGLHTAGAYPRRLAEVLPLCEWVGLDIKALPGLYAAVTGVRTSGVKAYESLRIVLDSGVDHEVRITVDPSLHSREHVETLVSRLRDAGVRSIALQQARFLGTPGAAPRTAEWRLTQLAGRLPDGVFLRTG